jgi:prephenate dehydratase
VSDVTGVSEDLPGAAPDARAVRAWNFRQESEFLDAFARPNPSADPPCERDGEGSVVQALHLMNSAKLTAKIASPAGRAAALAKSERTPRQIVEELYLATYSRPPSEEEAKLALAAFAQEGATRQTATEDVVWALLNSAEFVLEVELCLLAQSRELSRIRRVTSHPQPLGQCKQWLRQNLPQAELLVAISTTAAAQDALKDPETAAVGSRLAAELGLVVAREGIQDHEGNATRFLIVGKHLTSPTGNDKTTLVFSTPHERGALRRVLEVFDEEGLNLTRIESRPLRGQLWQYAFFTDLEGHRDDPAVERALERLRKIGAMVRVLGSYPRAPNSRPPA